jgi:uncharacterized membrane protein HdeD (DUF308 family)
MSATTPAGRGRLPLGKAVGQAWALYLAGFVALAGGIALVANPGAELRLVRVLLGLFLIGWGGLRLVHALTAPRRDRTWLLLSGLAILGAGIVALAWPDVTRAALVYIVVVGGLCLASVDLVGAFVGRRDNRFWWLQLLRGVGTIILVVVLLVWPGESLAVLRFVAGVLLILWGASALGEAYQSPLRDDRYNTRPAIDRETPHRLI